MTLCPAALEAGAAALPEAARLEPMPPSVFVCAIEKDEVEMEQDAFFDAACLAQGQVREVLPRLARVAPHTLRSVERDTLYNRIQADKLSESLLAY